MVDDIKINSRLTLGEDVADLGGTLLAYIAWTQRDLRREPQARSTASRRISGSSSAWRNGPAATSARRASE